MSEVETEQIRRKGRVRIAALARSVESTPDGMLHMLGAGWTQINTPGLPAQFTIHVGIQIADMSDNGVITVAVLDGAGQTLAGSSTLISVPPNTETIPLVTSLALTFPIVVQASGRHEVKLTGDIEDTSPIEFAVVTPDR